MFRSAVGNRETIRAISACYVKNGKFYRRFLHCQYILDKNAVCLAESIKDCADLFGIDAYELCADGASVNLAAAQRLSIRQHTCMSHTVHNIVSNSFASLANRCDEFGIFMKTVEHFLTKASRKSLNSKLMNEEGFIKIPTFVATRWLSRNDCFKSIVRNWNILEEHKHMLGLSQAEWNIFNNLELFEDLLELTNVASRCLLRFEVQKITTSQTVVPTLIKWHHQLSIFKLSKNRSNLAQLLAIELEETIDTYTFGTVGRNIRPRINDTTIIQSALSPETNFLRNLRKKLPSMADLDGGLQALEKANNEIEKRFNRFENMILPALKSSYS